MPRNKSEKLPQPPLHWPDICCTIASKLAHEAVANGMTANQMAKGVYWGDFTPKTDDWFMGLSNRTTNLWFTLPDDERRDHMASLMRALGA